ncbi:MAG: hypothetical protein ACRCYU_20455 [Nocardioides sp.]
MTELTAPELLAQEPRTTRSSRARLVVASVAAALVVVGVLVDREARDQETAALDECSAHIATATARAMAPVLAMAGYVRVTRDGSGGRLTRDLDAMIGQRAAKAGDTFAGAGAGAGADATCHRVTVGWWHSAATDRKARCLERLAEAREHLAEIGRDGGAVFRTSGSGSTPVC